MSPDFAARHWYRRSAVSISLWPASLAFGAAVRLRRLCYGAGWLRPVRLPVPVIVVGNLTVGGTGKTPLALWLAQFLKREGANPGILGRGYRGAGGPPRAVAAGDDPAQTGDEALLLARRSACPVWVGIDRVLAGRMLLRANPRCDVLICDDGLQHYRLARDLEIAVADERGYGNGLLLPAGPLREPASRPCDAFVINCKPASGGRDAFATSRAPGSDPTRPGGRYRMELLPAGFHAVGDPEREVPLAELRAKRLHAIAGIGDPGRFFATLRTLGLDPVTHAFADHHVYSSAELTFTDCDVVLMTEKDAVKCARFGRTDLVALRVDARLDAAFTEFIRERLHGFAPA